MKFFIFIFLFVALPVAGHSKHEETEISENESTETDEVSSETLTEGFTNNKGASQLEDFNAYGKPVLTLEGKETKAPSEEKRHSPGAARSGQK